LHKHLNGARFNQAAYVLQNMLVAQVIETKIIGKVCNNVTTEFIQVMDITGNCSEKLANGLF